MNSEFCDYVAGIDFGTTKNNMSIIINDRPCLSQGKHQSVKHKYIYKT